MTREKLIARLEELKKAQQEAQANFVQLQANLNAFQGAIQDCEYWLNELSREEKTIEE